MRSITRCSPQYPINPFNPFGDIFHKREPTWEEGVNKEVNRTGTHEFHHSTRILSLICLVLVVILFFGWLTFKLINYTVRKRHDRAKNQLDQKLYRQAARILKNIPTTVLVEDAFNGNDSSFDTCAVCIENCK